MEYLRICAKLISHKCIYGCRFSLNLENLVGEVKIQKENTRMELNNVIYVGEIDGNTNSWVKPMDK